jgi:DNA (cytosine-5)-methyltransferase 1
LNVLDLFSGIGGLGEATRESLSELGVDSRTIAYCERDKFCQALLMSRMSRGEIDKAPIWDDITTLSGKDIPRVDLIIGGWPCQGNSVAGLRKGMADERSGLVTEVIRLIEELRPSTIFLENVTGVLTAPGDGVGYVLREMAHLRYDVRWQSLRASQFGATHHRARFWLLAHAQRVRGAEGDRLRETRLNNQKSKIGMEVMGTSNPICEPKERQERPPGPGQRTEWEEYLRKFPTLEPALYGSPPWLQSRSNRTKALGNSVDYKCAKEALKILLTGEYNG